ncbi:MAG TPA: hypothetical protein RMG95_23700, partial [Polyangiaceae bacterium LLY-WYZ-15_(1-7)]|nr:hypothetical protein [Polyangiaceae bacterium LLY-WYZ-15_(1-7)]
MDPRPRSRPRSPAHAASRRIAQGAALALGALAFLRAPLGPALSPGPAWPPATEPRAHAASQPAPAPAVVAFALATPPPPRRRSPEPPAWRGPYRAFGPVEPRLHPVGWTAAELADAVDERLVSLEDLGDDEAGRDVLFLLGAEHQAQGDFLGAAEYYEAFAAHSRCAPGRDRDARCDAEVVALENAALFREALGQPGQSQANAALLAARHAQAHPRAATRLALRVGDGLPRSARAAHLETLRRRRLPPAEAILAELRLGRAREGRAGRAAFRRADRLWERHG